MPIVIVDGRELTVADHPHVSAVVEAAGKPYSDWSEWDRGFDLYEVLPNTPVLHQRQGNLDLTGPVRTFQTMQRPSCGG
jgi:hypothetical protein